MDVVRTNIERIGGAVDIYSAAGQGTTLKIKIPLTLAIIPALIVRSVNQSFALPQGALSELVHVPPAQAAKLCRPGQTVFIIGAGGKSGLLCAYEARKRVKPTGKVICLVHGNAGKKRLEKTGFADVIIQGSATDQLFVYEEVKKATGGEMADLTINCVDIPNTEMASVLATKNDGTVYFFSMATSFTSAALGAEGIGADTLMIIGNGYTKDHAVISLAVVRESPILMELFKDTYATGAGNAEPVNLKA